MNWTIDEIRSFVAVAQTGSFSGAARLLQRAQSVVSTHIAGLEAELGYQLFERTPKPRMTPRAEELLLSARRVLAETERMQLRARELAKCAAPSLYMGIDLALEVPVLIDWMQQFSALFPSTRITMENITGYEAEWFFSKVGMNLALVFSSEPTLENSERILGYSSQCIVVAKNHPLAGIPNPTVEDLRRYRQLVIYAVAPGVEHPHVISADHWEVDSGLWALGLAAKGIGWAILPRCLLLGRSIYKNAVVEIKPPFALEPERLVLRYRAGEVSTEILDWWEKKIIHYRRTNGVTDSPASKPD